MQAKHKSDYRQALIKQLKNIDFKFLHAIFELRCLSLKQAWLYYYKPKGISYEHFYRKRIIPLINAELLELQQTTAFTVIFLTDHSVQLVRDHFNICNQIYDDVMGKIRKDSTRASKLKLSPRLVSHQVYLNQFILNFQTLTTYKKYPAQFQYFNDRYASLYETIHPDAMIRLNKDTDFLLEMDMGTESNKQLQEKWSRYCIHMNRYANLPNMNKIVVLFIVQCDSSKIEDRKKLVRQSISNTFMDLFDKNFEIYVGTITELLGACTEKILPSLLSLDSMERAFTNKILVQQHKFSIGTGSKVQEKFGGLMFKYYIRKINDNNKICIQDGKIQEFLFDDYYYSPVSVLGRMQLINRTSSIFFAEYRRHIDYVILVHDVKDFYSQLKACGLLEIQGVYFTTMRRLIRTNKFHEALFTLTSEGDIKRPADAGCVRTVLEGNLFQDPCPIT